MRDLRRAPGDATRAFLILGAWLFLGSGAPAQAANAANDDCMVCHGEDKTLAMERGGKNVSLFVRPGVFKGTAHDTLACISCHQGFNPEEVPHRDPITRVNCGSCHAAIEGLHAKSLHGQAIARKDPLAPRCTDCHGKHDVLKAADPRSPVAPMKVPYLCGKCHREGAPVQLQRTIHADHILENYSESIHGEALFKKGLTVAPNCASCHTAHSILKHTDPASSIARRNIATTCAQCHSAIEEVHRKVIKGEMWEKQAHILPACIDCHQPHKVRKVYYDQGMADRDCMRCHDDPELKASKDGRSLQVHGADLLGSRHVKTACSQCHTGVTASRERPCETIVQKVDCSSCHVEIGQQHLVSTHGQLVAKNDPNAPTCKECHGSHKILGKADPASATFPTRVPGLCASCHREGEKAARRYKGTQHDIPEHYVESIHGQGLSKSGLTVTATCTSCHTAHSVLPKDDAASSVNRKNIPGTCGSCHHGIEDQFRQSIHSGDVSKSREPLPVCSDCHSAHTIARTDVEGFKSEIMNTCGRCHEEITKTYFETYHGKVSQLGYTKTAQCYDCHGSHEILPASDPKSKLSRDNVVKTCQKCHAGATRRFAGYLTHATHHDREKYPILYWTFWAMVSLLVVTFTVGFLHTMLWLPRALQMRREREARAAAALAGPAVAAVAPAAAPAPPAPPAASPPAGANEGDGAGADPRNGDSGHE